MNVVERLPIYIKIYCIITGNAFLGFHCLFDNNENSNEADFEFLVSFYLNYNGLSNDLGELKMSKLKLARQTI